MYFGRVFYGAGGDTVLVGMIFCIKIFVPERYMIVIFAICSITSR